MSSKKTKLSDDSNLGAFSEDVPSQDNKLDIIANRLDALEASITNLSANLPKLENLQNFAQLVKNMSSSINSVMESMESLIEKTEAIAVGLSDIPSKVASLTTSVQGMNTTILGFSTLLSEILKSDAKTVEVVSRHSELVNQTILANQAYMDNWLIELMSKSDEYLSLKYEVGGLISNSSDILASIQQALGTITASVSELAELSDENQSIMTSIYQNGQAMVTTSKNMAIPKTVLGVVRDLVVIAAALKLTKKETI